MQWLDQEFDVKGETFRLSGMINEGYVQITLHHGRQAAILFEKQYSSLSMEDPDRDVVRQYFAAKTNKYLNGFKKYTPDQLLAKHGLQREDDVAGAE